MSKTSCMYYTGLLVLPNKPCYPVMILCFGVFDQVYQTYVLSQLIKYLMLTLLTKVSKPEYLTNLKHLSKISAGICGYFKS